MIVSRFHGSPRDGHGNHQAAGLLTREAFKLAADPNAFSEQITKEYLSPWQAKKLYLSCRENEPYTLKIDTGVYDPLLGQTYRELASAGYSMHRSQSAGQTRPARGQSFSYLRLVESVAPKVENEKSIFDGLDTSIVGIAAGNPAAQETLRITQDQVEMAIRDFDARKPWMIVRHLVEGARQLRKVVKTYYQNSMKPADQKYPLVIHKAVRQDLDSNEAVNKALGLETSFNVSVSVSNNVKGATAGKVKLTMPSDWSSTPPVQEFKFASEGETGVFTFKVSAQRAGTGRDYRIQAIAEYAGREFTEGYRVIAYRDLEPRHLYAPATMDVRGVDVKSEADCCTRGTARGRSFTRRMRSIANCRRACRAGTGCSPTLSA